MFDVDNTPDKPSEPDIAPELWITPQAIKKAFPGVSFYVSYSRNHMKPKGGRTARPKFHVYFSVDPMTDAREYAALKERVQAYFPQFDNNAKDAARFFFGVENPQVEYYESEDGQ
jgi:hypothetical protein